MMKVSPTFYANNLNSNELPSKRLITIVVLIPIPTIVTTATKI